MPAIDRRHPGGSPKHLCSLEDSMFAALVAFTLTSPVAILDEKEEPLPEAAQKELKKFQGKWKAVKAIVNGAEENDGTNVTIEFKDRKMHVTQNCMEQMEFFSVTAIDPTTTAKLLDLKALVDMGPITKGTVYESIYKIDGDDLTIAIYFGEGKKRPEKFESEKDSMVIVVTFKREK
jgi:uncharacterized protein (TIGR03067 family)